MKIEYRHSLSTNEAYQKIDGLLNGLQKKYADKISEQQAIWNADHSQMNFNMTILGFYVEGNVKLCDGKITLEGKIPFVARMFSGKIENTIREQLDDLLS